MTKRSAIRHGDQRPTSMETPLPAVPHKSSAGRPQQPAQISKETAVERKAQRDADHKRLRADRRAHALGKAEALMKEAMPLSGMDRASVLPSISRLAGRELMADGCDLAMLQGRSGVIYHARPEKEPALPRRRTPGGTSKTETLTKVWKVEETLVASCPAPFDLVTRPSEFAISVHTFIRSADNADAHGVLSIYSEESRRFSVEEVAFLGALATLLGRAFDSAVGSPNHAA